jgi:hypothetical protein
MSCLLEHDGKMIGKSLNYISDATAKNRFDRQRDRGYEHYTLSKPKMPASQRILMMPKTPRECSKQLS